MQKTQQLKLNSEKLDDVKYFCAFSYLDVRPLFKSKLFEYFEYDIKRTWEADKNDIQQMCEFYELSLPREFLNKKAKLDPEKCYQDALSKEGVKILTYNNPKYPSLLKEIPDFPLSLYYLGDLENLDFSNTVAIVGSRNATTNAKVALNSIISDLNNTNIVIVSGLAYGIDATAHQSALDNNLKTVAVIGTGLDIQYPTQNKKLYSDIVQQGGVIFSEFPLKTQAYPGNFPQRNRIVVGMSYGTLVAEAQIKSGAMISANLTLDYNRELMCMPGNIMNANTSGIYHLIKNGASIVTSGADLLNNLNWDFKPAEKNQENLSEIQQKIMDMLSLSEMTFDNIMLQSNDEVSDIMIALTELELKGLIKQANNKYYKNK